MLAGKSKDRVRRLKATTSKTVRSYSEPHLGNQTSRNRGRGLSQRRSEGRRGGRPHDPDSDSTTDVITNRRKKENTGSTSKHFNRIQFIHGRSIPYRRPVAFFVINRSTGQHFTDAVYGNKLKISIMGNYSGRRARPGPPVQIGRRPHLGRSSVDLLGPLAAPTGPAHPVLAPTAFTCAKRPTFCIRLESPAVVDLTATSPSSIGVLNSIRKVDVKITILFIVELIKFANERRFRQSAENTAESAVPRVARFQKYYDRAGSRHYKLIRATANGSLAGAKLPTLSIYTGLAQTKKSAVHGAFPLTNLYCAMYEKNVTRVLVPTFLWEAFEVAAAAAERFAAFTAPAQPDYQSRTRSLERTNDPRS
ncbi:hypothetical protein EVAR_5000_1 [Eumeta japonica]|uniref:Uncharacterized protein n=1 Tax=Eumeta variegata TaxID=151549 RepID=A0A4C1UZ74_EUMVA|nr:hypothetical protein EVAR_5000_1 [Eumeta japonica]